MIVRKDQEGGKTMEEVFDFLKKAETYYLATVEGDQPRVRPFGTINIFEGKLYLQTGKIKPVSHQILANLSLIHICTPGRQGHSALSYHYLAYYANGLRFTFAQKGLCPRLDSGG